MVFSSLTFLFIFLPLTLLIYYVIPGTRRKNIVLLIASLLFYAWGEPVYVVLMILSILFNYFVGLDLSDENEARRKKSLFFGIVVNLLILGYFKYSSFLIDTVNSLFGGVLAHLGGPIRNPSLPLPIGISFYTFQAMSYLVDVYRGECSPQKRLSSFAVYITMFPQLIAGPIVRYEDIEVALNRRKFKPGSFLDGVLIFTKGLGKKVILANALGAVYTEITVGNLGEMSALTAWIAALCYSLQLFHDFSGYSDMAIGIGKMLGFHFPLNFDHPYRADSVTDFWRRWHISLGTWFREYVYIPLGGNRKGKGRQIINLLIVWGLTGLWHGAAWNFVAWGLYYGVLLILEKFVLANVLKKIPAWIRRVAVFVIVVVGWVFFSHTSFTEAAAFLRVMFTGGPAHIFTDRTGLFYLANTAVLLFAALIPAALPIDLFGTDGRLEEERKAERVEMEKEAIALALLEERATGTFRTVSEEELESEEETFVPEPGLTGAGLQMYEKRRPNAVMSANAGRSHDSVLTTVVYVALATLIFAFSVAYLVSDTYNPFLYFRF